MNFCPFWAQFEISDLKKEKFPAEFPSAGNFEATAFSHFVQPFNAQRL
jgi:hypothetical protein